MEEQELLAGASNGICSIARDERMEGITRLFQSQHTDTHTHTHLSAKIPGSNIFDEILLEARLVCSCCGLSIGKARNFKARIDNVALLEYGIARTRVSNPMIPRFELSTKFVDHASRKFRQALPESTFFSFFFFVFFMCIRLASDRGRWPGTEPSSQLSGPLPSRFEPRRAYCL